VGVTFILSLISVVSGIIGSIALLVAVRAFIKIEAMEKSTHRVQYVPVGSETTNYDENGFEIVTDELKEKMSDDELN